MDCQSSWVSLFRRLASPVSLVSSRPVESAISTVPNESFTTPSSGGGFFSSNPPGCVWVGFNFRSSDLLPGWMRSRGLLTDLPIEYRTGFPQAFTARQEEIVLILRAWRYAVGGWRRLRRMRLSADCRLRRGGARADVWAGGCGRGDSSSGMPAYGAERFEAALRKQAQRA